MDDGCGLASTPLVVDCGGGRVGVGLTLFSRRVLLLVFELLLLLQVVRPDFDLLGL